MSWACCTGKTLLPVVWSWLIDFVRGAVVQLADPDVFQDLSATPLMTASE